MSKDGDTQGIFRAVIRAYSEAGDQPLSNADLYRSVSQQLGLDLGDFSEKATAGRGVRHSRRARAARWTQQTLKCKGLIEKSGCGRGVWQLTAQGRKGLHQIKRDKMLVAFQTHLGLALWADARDAFRNFAEPIHLCLTSPPYPLAKPRDYGNPTLAEYVDFVCAAMEGVVKALVPGGSLVLNLTSDVFEPGSPARSLYLERLTIALHDRLGLKLMDRMPWIGSKAPGPVQWASVHRVHLHVKHEPILWLTNDPTRVRSSNQRVLEPHSPNHLRRLARDGGHGIGEYANGAYRLRPSSFKNQTAGKIPGNVRFIGHNCASLNRYRKACRELGLPIHGAMFPLALADFYIRFLTEGPDDLVVDNMSGSLTVGVAAEALGRRWICSEIMAEYLRGGATRFDGDGLWINPLIDDLLGIPRQPSPQLAMDFPDRFGVAA